MKRIEWADGYIELFEDRLHLVQKFETYPEYYQEAGEMFIPYEQILQVGLSQDNGSLPERVLFRFVGGWKLEVACPKSRDPNPDWALENQAAKEAYAELVEMLREYHDTGGGA